MSTSHKCVPEALAPYLASSAQQPRRESSNYVGIKIRDVKVCVRPPHGAPPQTVGRAASGVVLEPRRKALQRIAAIHGSPRNRHEANVPRIFVEAGRVVFGVARDR